MIDLVPLLPIIILSAAAVVMMLGLAIYRGHAPALATAVIALVLAMASMVVPHVHTFLGLAAPLSVRIAVPGPGTRSVELLAADGFSAFFSILILAQTLLICLVSFGYLRRRGGLVEEYYILVLTATVGALVLAGSTHFVSFFLGLEILSISLYPLIAYHRKGVHSVEAGFKYLVLAATAAAMLLLGMAFLYADLGTMQFAEIAERLSRRAAGGGGLGLIPLAGLGLIVVGLAFKLALAPLHLWTSDVYQGAPAPVTAFIASVSKGAVFAVLLRFFVQKNLNLNDAAGLHPIWVAVAVLAVASMFVGNLLALMQNNIKRLLAYSSIAQLGYLMVAFLSAGPLGSTAAGFFLLAYFVTIGAALSVVAALSGPDEDAQSLADYRGLAWRRPVLAAVLTASMLSLAGIPLTGGFLGKFYLAAAGVEGRLWWLVLVLLINSAIGLYYYLRVIAAMYMREPKAAMDTPGTPAPSPVLGAVHLTGSLALAAMTLLILWLGVYPAPFIEFIETLLAEMT